MVKEASKVSSIFDETIMGTGDSFTASNRNFF